jgi:hypothetical protein
MLPRPGRDTRSGPVPDQDFAEGWYVRVRAAAGVIAEFRTVIPDPVINAQVKSLGCLQ